MRDLTAYLTQWLEGGGKVVGQVWISRAEAGAFLLSHVDDRERGDLTSQTGADAARHLSTYDDAGAFRPLKTAPNLRHGWRLRLEGVGELRRALDYFYPAMLGVAFSQAHGQLQPVDLRETLGRQTGMYRITQKLTDEQAQDLVGKTCQSETGCLKHLLWRIAPALPIASLPPEKLQAAPEPGALPLLCHEACNLLVAQARVVVKSVKVE